MMKVGYGFVLLRFPVAQSLKDKRRILKSILSDLQRKYFVSAAEVDHLEEWQMAKIGFSFVGPSVPFLNSKAEILFQYFENEWDWEFLERKFHLI